MLNLKKRSYQAELMDELTLGGEEMAQTLRELKFINYWLGGNGVTLRGLNRLLPRSNGNGHATPISIADLGCGGGDMLALMANWARRRKLRARFSGVDANAFIIDYARQNTSGFPEVDYTHVNIFSETFARQPFDVVTCTLFCHHFTDDQLIQLFRNLRHQVRLGIVINDLHRHWLAYHSIKWLTHWFSRSYLVRNDAKLSVRRAFHRQELRRLLTEAGWTNVEIRWSWAFRWQVVAWK